jgi:predicted lipoprotein
MRSCSFVFVLSVALAGCQSPERAALQPLPPDAPQPTYTELIDRAERQVWAAQQFFYRDSWKDVELAAEALKETAVSLTKVKTDDLSAKQKDALPKLVTELTEAGQALREAGTAQDVNKTTQAFQRLHLVVRRLQAK